MRKLIGGLALLLGVLFIINQVAEIESILQVAGRANWLFVGLATLVELLWFVATAGTLATVFASLGDRRSLISLVPIGAAANFINTVAPSVGMSGLAVLVSDARRRRHSGARATVAGALFMLSEYVGFLIILAAGLLVLFQRGLLDATQLLPAGFLFFCTFLIGAGLYLGMRSEQALARVLVWGVRSINKIAWPLWHRQVLSEAQAGHFAAETAEGLSHLRHQPQKLLPALLYSLASKGVMMLVMLLMFEAFNVRASASTILASYAVAYLFLIVSPTPAGLGVVEGLLTLSLVSFAVPVAAAAMIVLGYRAVTFWLPLLLGLVAFQLLSLQPEKVAVGD